MTIAAEYSLIPYEPNRKPTASRRAVTAAYTTGARNPASRRDEPRPSVLSDKPRRSATTYSFHRTLADSRTAATGLRVDIFV